MSLQSMRWGSVVLAALVSAAPRAGALLGARISDACNTGLTGRDTLRLVSLTWSNRSTGEVRMWADSLNRLRYAATRTENDGIIRFDGDVSLGRTGLPDRFVLRWKESPSNVGSLSVERAGDSIIVVNDDLAGGDRRSTRTADYLAANVAPFPPWWAEPEMAVLAQCALARGPEGLPTYRQGVVRATKAATTQLHAARRVKIVSLYMVSSDSNPTLAHVWLDESGRVFALPWAGAGYALPDEWKSNADDLRLAELRATAGTFPQPPHGLANRALPKGPFQYSTAEDQDVVVSVVTNALNFPYALMFLPDGSLLVTERRGQLRVVRNGVLDPQPVGGGPASYWEGESGQPGNVHGYMNLALHPRFAENQLIYLSYTKPPTANRTSTAVAQAHWNGHALTDVRDIFVVAGAPGAMPIVFGRDGKLYIATHHQGHAQDPNSLDGKVLRLNDDGSVPSDNPFVGREGHRPEVYTLGHRSPLGITVHPVTGDIWLSENGPNGGDEVNIIHAGLNYGWPLVSLGRTYTGPWVSDRQRPTHENFEPPVVYWTPSIAISGLTFYTGDALPRWKGDLFVGGMRTGEIPGTGRLDRVLFNSQVQELRRESLLGDLRQRIRDVAQGPDGFLYVVTDEGEGALLRIEPGRSRRRP